MIIWFKRFASLLLILTTISVSLHTMTVRAGMQWPDNYFSRNSFTELVGYGLMGLAMVTTAQSLVPRQTADPLPCLPEDDGRIPLGQDNFTLCLGQNALGRYVLVDSVNFSNFSLEDQMQYPLYNFSSPFRGELNTGPYHIADLYLNKIGLSGLFGAISGSTLNVNFKNPSVVGTNHSAVLAAMAYGDNTINMTTDRATVATICALDECGIDINATTRSILEYSGRAGIVLGDARDGDYTISLVADTTDTSTGASFANSGIIAGKFKESTLDARLNIGDAQLTSLGKWAYAGAVGQLSSSSVDLQARFGTIDVSTQEQASAAAAGVGVMSNSDQKKANINISADTVDINTLGYKASASVALAADLASIRNVHSPHQHKVITVDANDVTLMTFGDEVDAGVCLGRSSGILSHVLNASINTLRSSHTGRKTCAGGIIGSTISSSVTDKQRISASFGELSIMNLGLESATGALVGCADLNKVSILEASLKADAITLFANNTPAALVVGNARGIEKKSYAIINGVSAIINGNSSAVGVGSIAPEFGGSEKLSILFVAGSVSLAEPSFVLQPDTRCPYSLIDQSGVDVNTDEVGCQGAVVVQSIEPAGWQMAMAQVKPALCRSSGQSSCHYPNEQRVALASSPDGLYLISQQRYPYNLTAEENALTRITGLTFAYGQEAPVVNADFGMNGIALHQSQSTERLPLTSPHSTSINGTHLFHLYKKNNASMLAVFDLSQSNSTYFMNTIDTEGNVVQLDRSGLWLQRNQSLEYHVIDPTLLTLMQEDEVLQLTDNDLEDFSSTSIIGARSFDQGTYVARLMKKNNEMYGNHSTILYEHYPSDGTPAVWNETIQGNFSNLNQYAMYISPNTTATIIGLLPSTEILVDRDSMTDPMAYTVDIMSQGGPAQWRHEKLPIFAVRHQSKRNDPNNSNPNESSKVLAPLLGTGATIVVAVGLTGAAVLIGKKVYHKKRNDKKEESVNKENSEQ